MPFCMYRMNKDRLTPCQQSPEMNISDIAYRLGFGNPQYFNKCFKELFDIAPTQYRKSHDAPSDPSVK